MTGTNIKSWWMSYPLHINKKGGANIMGMLKVTISGDYRTSGGAHGDIVDFEKVVGVMPECPEEWVKSHIMNRFLSQWLKADSRYPARFNARRSVYIDSIEKVSGQPSCIGKDIKVLSWDELQELAVLKHLCRIPLTHAVNIRSARETAYLEYSDKILNNKIDTNRKDYSFAELPALVVQAEGVAEEDVKKSNEEVISQVQEETGEFTLDELKTLAKEKGIEHPTKIGYNRLYRLVFPD